MSARCRTSVAVTHRFETAHRLPMLGGKCTNLHGHSWRVTVAVSGPVPPTGVLLEFAALKTGLRGWVDTHLDHGVMLGYLDPLYPVLRAAGKVFTFGEPVDHPAAGPLLWPTVENVAALLAGVSTVLVAELIATDRAHPGTTVSRVDVGETAVNEATWECG